MTVLPPLMTVLPAINDPLTRCFTAVLHTLADFINFLSLLYWFYGFTVSSLFYLGYCWFYGGFTADVPSKHGGVMAQHQGQRRLIRHF